MAARSGARVLVVEDEPDESELVVCAVRAVTSRRVNVVVNGYLALDYLFCRGDYVSNAGNPAPALVLLDLGLPKIHGLDVVVEMRTEPRLRHVPVVVLTYSTDEAFVGASYLLGVNSFLRKPIDIDDCRSMVQQAATYWLCLNWAPTQE